MLKLLLIKILKSHTTILFICSHTSKNNLQSINFLRNYSSTQAPAFERHVCPVQIPFALPSLSRSLRLFRMA